ncbi:unnamed protein product [Durusdinium trenchii]|uniref:Uncharacterized protein n=1 Tax=Durusdinium trenchii TaxID=1381693 RepID=A0ABP0H7P0_9DINO
MALRGREWFQAECDSERSLNLPQHQVGRPQILSRTLTGVELVDQHSLQCVPRHTKALAAFLEIQSFDGFQAGHSFRRYPDAASFLDTSKDQTAKAAGRAADEALDYAYNAEAETMRASGKADQAEEQTEAAEAWEDYELSLLAFLSLVMVGTTGWLYSQYQRWVSLKKAMADHYHGRTQQ